MFNVTKKLMEKLIVASTDKCYALIKSHGIKDEELDRLYKEWVESGRKV